MVGMGDKGTKEYSAATREYSKGANLGIAIVADAAAMALLAVLFPAHALVVVAAGLAVVLFLGVASMVHFFRVVRLGRQVARQKRISSSPTQDE